MAHWLGACFEIVPRWANEIRRIGAGPAHIDPIQIGRCASTRAYPQAAMLLRIVEGREQQTNAERIFNGHGMAHCADY